MTLVIPILSTATRGQADIDPVGGPIVVAGKTLAIHQDFDKPGPDAVKSLPVLGHGS